MKDEELLQLVETMIRAALDLREIAHERTEFRHRAELAEQRADQAGAELTALRAMH